MAEQDRQAPGVFPGLRPFEPDEAYLFFGRDGQSDELVRRLARNRFLAVVGTSGSGKSSLVRAGLLAFLRSGFMSEAGSSWRIALLRPGISPISSLAAALNADGVLGNGDLDSATRLNHLETTLRRSSFGLIEAVRQAQLDPHQNLLVVVDQFEEIFRLRRAHANGSNHDDEAAAFVKLLLEASHQTEVPIYVVITMRSDFIGDCSEFRDLPESLNQSQYLIPRMTRDQCQEAIEGPIAVGGATITPRLVQRLLNDAGDNPDRLPVLQHVLMRTWETWSGHSQPSEPVDLSQYIQIGGMAAALSRHADEAFAELDERGRDIARKMFQRLSEIGKDNRESRRPTSLSEICAVVDADEATVIAVIDRFRTAGRSFLAPYAEQALTSDSVIEISHESLIRLWDRLRLWAEDEAESATLYRRLVDAAARHAAGGAALWRDPELQLAIDWRERSRPNAAWAERYGGEFNTAMRFLELSQGDARYRDRIRRAGLVGSIVLSIVFAGIGIFAFLELREARRLSLLSFARELASQAELLKEQDSGQADLASLLAVEAVRHAPMVETTGAAYQMLRSLPLMSMVFPRPADPKTRVAQALSADGQYIAYAVGDNVTLFDARTEKQVSSVAADNVRAVAFSPEGKFVAVACDYYVIVAEAATGKKVWRRDVVWPAAVALSSRAKYAAISYQSHVEVVQIEGNSLLFDLPRKQDVTTSGAAKELAPQSPSPPLRPRVNPRFVHNGYHAMDFSADNRLFAAAGENVENAVYDLQNGTRIYELVGARYVSALAFAPGNDVLVTAGDDISVFDQTGGVVRERIRSESNIDALAISPDGRYIAAAGSDAVELFDSIAGKATGSLGTVEPAKSVAFGAQGFSLVAVTSSRTLTFGPLEDRKIVLSDASALGPVAISPGGKLLAMLLSLSQGAVCRIVDIASGKEVSRRELSYDSVAGIAISGEGKHLALIPRARSMVPIIDSATGTQEPDYLASGKYSAVAFSANGLFVGAARDASQSDESEVLIGERMRSSLVRPLLPKFRVNLLTFSLDGKYLAAAGDKSIVIYKVGSDNEIAQFDAPAGLHAITLSADAKYLACASNRITVFDVASHEPVISYALLAPSPGAMGLTGDGANLLVASAVSDGFGIGEYPSQPLTLADEVCRRLVRNLTREEWTRYLGSESYRRTCGNLP